MTDNDPRAAQRAAELLPEEASASVDRPQAMAEALLAESDERQADRDAAPGTFVEHRSSGEA